MGRSGSGRRAKHAAVTSGKAEGASSATKTASIVSVTHFLPLSGGGRSGGGRSDGGICVPPAAVASNCRVSRPASDWRVSFRLLLVGLRWFPLVLGFCAEVSCSCVACLVRRFCRLCTTRSIADWPCCGIGPFRIFSTTSVQSPASAPLATNRVNSAEILIQLSKRSA